MTTDHIKARLISVLESIQANSGLPCPPISGALRPIRDLQEFDSKIWPVAIGILATDLGITIPDDVNIFASDDGQTPRSVDEIAACVGDLVNKSKKKEPA